jgi:hypothetical protein
MSESKSEQIARVRRMAWWPDGTWALGVHDVEALAAVLADRDALLDAVQDVAPYCPILSQDKIRALVANVEGRS